MRHLLFDHIVEIQMFKSVLEDEGIGCFVKNEFEESILAGFAIGVPGNADLYVDDADYERAVDIINKFRKTIDV